MKIRCTLATLDKAINALDRYQKSLPKKNHEMLEKLAELGSDKAISEFGSAFYDGENDVDVGVDWFGNDTVEIVAKGDAVAFIEFGTGTVYTTPVHPVASITGLVGRGEFGQGRGKYDYWYYDGDPGSGGIPIQIDGRSLVKTQGNPANMCLYYTMQDVKSNVRKVAKEVFGK